MEGVVVSDPEAAGRAVRFRLAVERVAPNGRWESGSGEALVTLVPSSIMAAKRAAPHVRYGDRLLLEGVL